MVERKPVNRDLAHERIHVQLETPGIVRLRVLHFDMVRKVAREVPTRPALADFANGRHEVCPRRLDRAGDHVDGMQNVDEFVRVSSGRPADEVGREVRAANGFEALDEGGQKPRAFLGGGFVGARGELQRGTNAGGEGDARVPGAVAEVDVAFDGAGHGGRSMRWKQGGSRANSAIIALRGQSYTGFGNYTQSGNITRLQCHICNKPIGHRCNSLRGSRPQIDTNHFKRHSRLLTDAVIPVSLKFIPEPPIST